MYSLFAAGNYKQLRLEGIEKTVEFETEKVNKIIAEIERSAIFFATGGQLCYKAQSKDFGETLALELFRSFPMAIGGGFWFAPYAYHEETYREGFYAFYDMEQGAIRLDDTFFIDEYDYHNMSWYTEIAGALTEFYQVVWTAPYVDDSGSYALMTTAGAGIFDEGGVLVALSTVDWEIEAVIAELSAIKPTEGSFVLLCAPKKDYIITNTYTKDSAGASLKSLPWDISADSFDLEGIRYIAFRRVMDNGWLLSVQIPANEIFAEMESQNKRFMMIIVFSSLLMLLSAFYLISSLINKPLKRLTDEVSQIGLGNLDMLASVGTKDELGLRAETFNKMTADLRLSIDNFNREHTEKERIGAELSVAARIQANMLPSIFPAFPNHDEIDLYASMQPAKEVGGDFYDFFLIDDHTLAVVVAVVSGKGVPAALFMVIAKTLIKNSAQSGKSPKEVFETVNNMLCENNEDGMFVTVFMGYLDMLGGTFTYVNAGHNPPLLCSRSHERAAGKADDQPGTGLLWLKEKPGFVLAGMEDMFYKQHEIVMQPDDVLFLYTDGVTEAMDGKNNLFGEQRLFDAFYRHSDLPLKELVISLKREIEKFAGGAEQADDITMLALAYGGKYDE
jgi:serine phosphatase RsbU (regulator of sigma subunit)